MKIGIDIDEVIAEFVKSYILLLKERGIFVNYEDVINYHFWESFPITKEEDERYIKEFFNSHHFDEIKLVDGSQSSINFLSKNHEIYFITSRPSSIKEKTCQFIHANFSLSELNIFFSGDFHLGNGKTKAEICRELHIDLMIEDNKNYALDCAKNGIKVILLGRPWNKDFKGHKNISKVDSWSEILEEIKQYEL